MTWYKWESWGIEEIFFRWGNKLQNEFNTLSTYLTRELFNSLSYIPNLKAAVTPYKVQDCIVYTFKVHEA